MVEKDKDSLKKSLAKSLLHTQSLTGELAVSQAGGEELLGRIKSLEEELEKVGGEEGGQIWAQMGQIRDFFRSDFSTFWRRAPKCTEI